MSVTTEELNELWHFFSNTTLPQRIKVNNATAHNDVPALVGDCFSILQDTTVSSRIRDMRVLLLREIKAAIERKEAGQ